MPRPASASRALRLAVLVAVIGASLTLLVETGAPVSDDDVAATPPAAEPPAAEPPAAEPPAAEPPEPVEPDQAWSLDRVDDPPRTVVQDTDGNWIATFTDDASTVLIAGPERSFDEPTATNAVTTEAWVRLLPGPFDGDVDATWLEAARADTEPDVLEVAMQYLDGAPQIREEDGTLIAGEASYGPLRPDGTRAVGSDWHDYRGVDADYGHLIDPADPEEYGALDCSGYTRTVYGARLEVSMSLRPDGGTSLPRRSFEQAAEAPGVVPIPDGELDVGRLQAGDLVFFDLGEARARIDHVGIYLGEDAGGDHRFLHSRPTADGPTMGGDDHGPSILNGAGLYAEGFVSTRRL